MSEWIAGKLQTKVRKWDVIDCPAVNEDSQFYQAFNWIGIGISTSPSATLTLEQDNIMEKIFKLDLSVIIGRSAQMSMKY